MKMFLLFTSIFFININVLSQVKSNFERGFEVGFKEGYCYNRPVGSICSYPIIIYPPTPKLNESSDNYTQGYNRGFQYGLDLKRSNEAINEGDINLNQRMVKFNEYISQNPVDAMVAVGMIKQATYDARKDWIQQRIDALSDLSKTLFNEQSLPININAISTRESTWQKVVIYVNSIRSSDFADNYQFSSIQTNFNKLEKYFYDTYNEIVSQNFEREITKISNPETMGKISFWTNLKRSGNMKVYLDGNYIGSFTSYFDTGTPACGQQGTITVSRSPGTYNYYAVSEGTFGNKTWRGTITVMAGNCSLQGLVK
jgi:hypothetical protein